MNQNTLQTHTATLQTTRVTPLAGPSALDHSHTRNANIPDTARLYIIDELVGRIRDSRVADLIDSLLAAVCCAAGLVIPMANDSRASERERARHSNRIRV